MRMHFNHDTAWKHLQENGKVVTLRGPGPTPHTVDVRIYRHGKDTGIRATRQYIKDIEFGLTLDDITLEAYLKDSGFDTIDDWKEAALEMSDEQEYWRLFLVEVR